MLEKLQKLFDEANSPREEFIKENIFKVGFHKHILDKKRPYWDEDGEGKKLYKFIAENSELIEHNVETIDRGRPRKDSSFVTQNIYEIYKYNDLKIKVEIIEARSGNKRYTIDIYK